MSDSANAANPSVSDGTLAVPVEAAPVPRWAIHRRLYNWVLSWAHRRHSTTALFLLAVTESSVFPIPPDVLQIALTLGRRERAWLYATVSAVGSVLGGMLGYLIGWAFWLATQDFFFQYVFSQSTFNHVQGLYHRYDFWVIFVAAFTPIPYKVFTIAAGVFGIAFPMFVIASVVGRSARFFLVASLLFFFGPPMKRFIEGYFDLLCIVFTVLLIGGFAVIKLATGQ